MSHISSSSKNNSFTYYFNIAASFTAAKLSVLAIRHPIDVIKTNKQAFPNLTNSQIIAQIYEKNGVPGFYRSTNIAILKILAAESYRGLLMIQVPLAIRGKMPKSWVSTSPMAVVYTTSLLSIPIIAGIDTTLICPLVRISTLQITAENNLPISKVYAQHIKGNTLKQVYRGFNPLLLQTSILWANFLFIDDLIKSLIKRHFRHISYSQIALGSIVGGTIQTFVNVIPDAIRVNMQKATGRQLNMRNTTNQLIRQHGIRALFNAVPHKIFGGIVTYGYKSMLRHYWTHNSNA